MIKKAIKKINDNIQEVYGENLEPDFVQEAIDFMLTYRNEIALLVGFITIPVLFYMLYRMRK